MWFSVIEDSIVELAHKGKIDEGDIGDHNYGAS